MYFFYFKQPKSVIMIIFKGEINNKLRLLANRKDVMMLILLILLILRAWYFMEIILLCNFRSSSYDNINAQQREWFSGLQMKDNTKDLYDSIDHVNKSTYQ